MDEIKTKWHDPKIGYLGKKAFAQKIGKKPKDVSLIDEPGYVFSNTPIRKHPRLPTFVHAPNELHQYDLADMDRYLPHNNGYRYILVGIDVFTKFVQVVPLKTKSAKDMVAAFQSIFTNSPIPEKIQTDRGTEFYNKEVQQLFKKDKIHHYSTTSDLSAAVVERVNRTLKQRMGRYFETNNTHRWIDVLQDLVYNYNHTKHTTIGMTPTEALEPENAEKIRDRFRAKTEKIASLPPTFEPGDWVVILENTDPFAKESQVYHWTHEKFEVQEVLPTVPTTYRIRDVKGETLQSVLYPQEMQKVSKPSLSDERRIHSILKERTRKGIKESLVKFIGINEPEWIPTSAISSVKN